MFPSSSKSLETSCRVFSGHVLIYRTQPRTQTAPENGKEREGEKFFHSGRATLQSKLQTPPSLLSSFTTSSSSFSFALPLSYKDNIPFRSMWSTLPLRSNFPPLSSLLVLHHSQTSSVCLSVCLSPFSNSLCLSLSLSVRCHLQTCVGRRSQWIPGHKPNCI